MIFEVGKYYSHEGGLGLHMLARVETYCYGVALIAEETSGAFRPCGEDETNAAHFREITEDEWRALCTGTPPERPAIEGSPEAGVACVRP